MVSRAESAAATRRALLDAAADLLDEGGPDAVTLREVGARAGVSRGAPYGHFADKESLLTAVATESLDRLGHDPLLPIAPCQIIVKDSKRKAEMPRVATTSHELLFSLEDSGGEL